MSKADNQDQNEPCQILVRDFEAVETFHSLDLGEHFNAHRLLNGDISVSDASQLPMLAPIAWVSSDWALWSFGIEPGSPDAQEIVSLAARIAGSGAGKKPSTLRRCLLSGFGSEPEHTQQLLANADPATADLFADGNLESTLFRRFSSARNIISLNKLWDCQKIDQDRLFQRRRWNRIPSNDRSALSRSEIDLAVFLTGHLSYSSRGSPRFGASSGVAPDPCFLSDLIVASEPFQAARRSRTSKRISDRQLTGIANRIGSMLALGQSLTGTGQNNRLALMLAIASADQLGKRNATEPDQHPRYQLGKSLGLEIFNSYTQNSNSLEHAEILIDIMRDNPEILNSPEPDLYPASTDPSPTILDREIKAQRTENVELHRQISSHLSAMLPKQFFDAAYSGAEERIWSRMRAAINQG